MTDYQDRKDIDELYNIVWDNEANQLKLPSKEYVQSELNEYYTKEEVEARLNTFSDNDETNAKLEYILSLVDKTIDNTWDSSIYYSEINCEEDESNFDTLTKELILNIEFADENNHDGFRPPTVYVQVKKSDDPTNIYRSVWLSESNNWSETITVQRNFSYSISTYGLDAYDWNVVMQGNVYTILAKYDIETIDVKLVFENDDSSNLSEATVQLFADDKLYQSETMTVTNTAIYKYLDVPKWRNATDITGNTQRINYKPFIPYIEGYTTSFYGSADTQFNVIIRKNVDTGNILVNLQISTDAENINSSTDLKVQVKKGNKVLTTIPYSEFSNGEYLVDKLEEDTYYFEVLNPEDLYYDGVYNSQHSTTTTPLGVDVTQGETLHCNLGLSYDVPEYDETDPIPKTDLVVKVIWDDEDDLSGFRPNSVSATLYAGGEDIREITLSPSNSWTSVFTDMDVTYHNVPIRYKVAFDTVSNYTGSVDGLTITYTHVPPKTSRNIIIEWDDNNDSHNVRPSTVSAILSNTDGKRIRLNSGMDWNGWITDLPVYKNGETVNYAWVVGEVPNYMTYSVSTVGYETTIVLKILE